MRQVALDIAAGLQHCHARDICHHDLKGANVLLEEEPVPGGGTRLRALLADFGMAGHLRQAWHQAQRCARCPLPI